MKIDDVTGGQININGTTYDMVEAKVNGVVVWPSNVVYTYQIVASTVQTIYSGVENYIRADGANYAYIIGDVNVYANGVFVRTITGASLTPVLRADTAFHLNAYGSILGDDLWRSEKSVRTETVDVHYDTSASVTASVTQEANIKTETSRTATGSKKYGIATITYSDYQVSISADKYTSAIAAAPASGALTTALRATLSVSASHLETGTRPWTQDALVSYSYTSGATSSATVTDYYSGTETDSPVSVTDTPTISGGATGFTRNNLYVTIASEGTTAYPAGRSATYTATVTKIGGGTVTASVTLYQLKNEIVNTTDNTVRTTGTAYDTNTQDNYNVLLNVSNFTTTSTAALASGSEASMAITASHRNIKITHTPYTDTTTYRYTWSSGAISTDTETTTGVIDGDPVYTTITDSPTPTVSGEGFSLEQLSGTWYVIVASRGTVSSMSARSGLIEVSNGDASASQRVWQARNWYTEEYVMDLSVVIDYSGAMLPSTGGFYNVTAHSYRYTRRTYDSGEQADVSRTNYSAPLSTENCSPTTSISSISGERTFQIEVGPNSSTTDVRTVSLTLTAGGETATDSRMQDSQVEPGVGQVATLLPYIPKVGTNRGKVYYTLDIERGTTTSSTVSLRFCYQRNGGSKQTINVGNYNISVTAAPVLFNPSGAVIPNFTTARTVKAWFEVVSTGDFSMIHADEDTYYTYVEFDPYVPPTPVDTT